MRGSVQYLTLRPAIHLGAIIFIFLIAVGGLSLYKVSSKFLKKYLELVYPDTIDCFISVAHDNYLGCEYPVFLIDERKGRISIAGYAKGTLTGLQTRVSLPCDVSWSNTQNVIFMEWHPKPSLNDYGRFLFDKTMCQKIQQIADDVEKDQAIQQQVTTIMHNILPTLMATCTDQLLTFFSSKTNISLMLSALGKTIQRNPKTLSILTNNQYTFQLTETQLIQISQTCMETDEVKEYVQILADNAFRKKIGTTTLPTSIYQERVIERITEHFMATIPELLQALSADIKNKPETGKCPLNANAEFINQLRQQSDWDRVELNLVRQLEAVDWNVIFTQLKGNPEIYELSVEFLSAIEEYLTQLLNTLIWNDADNRQVANSRLIWVVSTMISPERTSVILMLPSASGHPINQNTHFHLHQLQQSMQQRNDL